MTTEEYMEQQPDPDECRVIGYLHRKVEELIDERARLQEALIVASNDLPEWSRRYEQMHGHRERVHA